MPYNEYAATLIQAKPNGNAFLQRVQKGDQPTEQELMQFFPPADQEQAFQRAIADKLNASAKEIDPRTGQFFASDRLIERAVQKHFGGDAAVIDSPSCQYIQQVLYAWDGRQYHPEQVVPTRCATSATKIL